MAGIGFSFEIKGIENLAKKLGKEAINDPVAEGIKKITQFLHTEVQKATPVDTGNLRGSITRQITPQFGKVGTFTPYASFVEYGTTRMKARHVEGGQRRVLGIGMFTYGMQKLQSRIGDFLKDVGKAIEVRFGS